MKKTIKLLLGSLIILIFAVILLPQTAEAKNKIIKTTPNKWYTLKESETKNYERIQYIYRITVPKNSYMKFQTNTTDLAFWVNHQPVNDPTPATKMLGSRTYYRILPAGKYYISGPSPYYKKKIRIRYSFSKTKETYNYCGAEALELPRNKTEIITVEEDTDFPRWYTITLTQNQKVTFISTSMDGKRVSNIYLTKLGDDYHSYPEQLKPDKSKENEEQTICEYTYNSLAPGTYYIKAYTLSDLFKIKWK